MKYMVLVLFFCDSVLILSKIWAETIDWIKRWADQIILEFQTRSRIWEEVEWRSISADISLDPHPFHRDSRHRVQPREADLWSHDVQLVAMTGGHPSLACVPTNLVNSIHYWLIVELGLNFELFVLVFGSFEAVQEYFYGWHCWLIVELGLCLSCLVGFSLFGAAQEVF